MVTPLANPIEPPDNNPFRAMFVNVGTPGSSADPLATTSSQQALINFCGTHKINLLYLDMYTYLGGASNQNSMYRTRLRQFIDAASRSTIAVHALAGDIGWGDPGNQNWVSDNIIKNIAEYNTSASSPTYKFSGLMLDVEWWTDPNATDQVNAPGLANLIKSAKKTLDISVGCFAAYYLKDNDGTRPLIDYEGQSKQAGAILMDVSDSVVVGAYRNHANDNLTDGPGQISLFQPWFEYASNPDTFGTADSQANLFCASETINVPPSYITYYGLTKSYFNSQATQIASTFTALSPTYQGLAVHNYAGFSAMPT